MSAKQTEGHPQCRLCRDGTYATQTMQMFADEDSPWEPYCDPCASAFASVLKDSQDRTPEIRALPKPPAGKAAPAPPKTPTPKPSPSPPGKVGKKAKTSPVAPLVEAPQLPPEAPPRKSLVELMRPTAPKPMAPVSPPPVPAPAPVSAKSAKAALREALQETGDYDLLTMLGMKR